MTIIIFIIYTTKQQSRIQRDSLVQALLYNNININMFGVVRTNNGIIDETFDYKFTKEIPAAQGVAQSVELTGGEVQMEIFGDFQI